MKLGNLAPQITWTVGCAALIAGMAPERAEACGGLFCSNVPVNQTEEAIIFDVDTTTNEVAAVINIFYQGSAEEFAWLLPLQIEPHEINPGSTNAFILADQLTRPQHFINEVEDIGVCSGGYGYPGFFGAESFDASAGAPAPNQRADDGVEVLQRSEVGPYDTVVLAGTDPEAIRTWLIDNGFRVTDEMMKEVVPYVAKGDVLLALKLLNDKDAGDVQPIEVKMRGSDSKKVDACVPIRLTSIAANNDMPITIYVFTDAGRAIPENFFHVVPNQLKIDWMNFGSNYRQIVAQAVDEADAGHAFVTEYAGSPDIFKGQIYDPTRFDLAALEAANANLGDFLEELQSQGLNRRAGVQDIIAARYPQLADCRGCQPDEFRGIATEPADIEAMVAEIDKTILAPDRRAQEIMDGRKHFTRLLTMLDPEEMTLDPIFNYRDDLGRQSNVHTAKMIRDCGVGGTPGSAGVQIILEDGRIISYDSNSFEPDRTVIDSMPAAERIDQLHDRVTVRDNTAVIASLLENHNERNGTTGGCASAKHAKGSALSSLALAALFGLVIVRRRRKS